MQLLDLTLPTPAENLALDEALLETAETAGGPQETLRLWESPTPMVVVGRATQIDQEVNVPACRELGIPILRRHSGGAAIVAGPGCLMYGVILSYQRRPQLRMIDEAHKFVLNTLATGLQTLLPAVDRQGISDLTIDGHLKFSGNSLRCCRTHLLYHGTILYDFPLDLIGQCLKHPPRQPDYRQQRAHGQFVANLPVNVNELRQTIAESWQSNSSTDFQVRTQVDWPQDLTAQLAANKYSCSAWNESR